MNIHEYVGKYIVLTDKSNNSYIMRLSDIKNDLIYNDICYSHYNIFWQNGGLWGSINDVSHIRLAMTHEIKRYLRNKINYYEIY